MSDPALLGRLLLSGLLGGWLLSLALPSVLRALGLERTNYQGNPIGTGGGLLFLLAALPWCFLAHDPATRAMAVAAAGFGLLGLIDDRWGSAEFKGLRGHFGALRQGTVTTGLVKLVGGLVLAGGLAWWLRPGWEAAAAPLIALSANLLNLLDLRPLRSLKAFWLLSLPLLATGHPLLWQTVGLSAPYAVQEARRRVMLGDTGANLLGAMLGVGAVVVLPPPAQAGLAGALLLFHLWAERNSISAWIEARPWARALDRWGWADSSST